MLDARALLDLQSFRHRLEDELATLPDLALTLDDDRRLALMGDGHALELLRIRLEEDGIDPILDVERHIRLAARKPCLCLVRSAHIDALAAGAEGIGAAFADDDLAHRLPARIEQAHETGLGVRSGGVLEIEQRPAILRGRLGLGKLGVRELHEERVHLVGLHRVAVALLDGPMLAIADERQCPPALGDLDAAERVRLAAQLRHHGTALDQTQ